MEKNYIVKDGKKLRCGYTTGSCAAAAARAASRMLLSGEAVEEAALRVPEGRTLHLLIEDISRGETWVKCAVRKDAGDDPDVTDGILVYAEVKKIPPTPEDASACSKAGSEDFSREGKIFLYGGEGVGLVTRPGMSVPPGEAAINPVPREMILSGVEEVCREAGYEGDLSVVISIPAGTELAEKTFNPRLGIEGGISVLGTSGIVVPMSEDAIIESLRLEMRMLRKAGGRYLVITPGNYGQIFSREKLDIDLTYSMKCSNYVGETLDMAAELGVEGILFISHIGKFIKVSGGIMNTHSKNADSRAELMAAQAIRAGASREAVERILASATTEESVQILKEDGHLQDSMQIAAERVQYYLDRRSAGSLKTGAILFSNTEGILAQTEAVPELMKKINEQGNRA